VFGGVASLLCAVSVPWGLHKVESPTVGGKPCLRRTALVPCGGPAELRAFLALSGLSVAAATVVAGGRVRGTPVLNLGAGWG
jgi:hypothetical protein